MTVPSHADRALDDAVDRVTNGEGLPDPADLEGVDALRTDDVTVELASAVARLDFAESAAVDEVRALTRAGDREGDVADLDPLASDVLGVFDDARALLDRRVAQVLDESCRVERHGQTVDLRHTVMRDCPVCEAGEELHQTGREWFAHLGAATTTSTGEELVDGWLCLGCGSVVHERRVDGRVEEARVVDVDPRGSDLSAEDLDVSEAWHGADDDDVDRGEGAVTDGGVDGRREVPDYVLETTDEPDVCPVCSDGFESSTVLEDPSPTNRAFARDFHHSDGRVCVAPFSEAVLARLDDTVEEGSA